jgi:hypothetical protein
MAQPVTRKIFNFFFRFSLRRYPLTRDKLTTTPGRFAMNHANRHTLDSIVFCVQTLVGNRFQLLKVLGEGSLFWTGTVLRF